MIYPHLQVENYLHKTTHVHIKISTKSLIYLKNNKIMVETWSNINIWTHIDVQQKNYMFFQNITTYLDIMLEDIITYTFKGKKKTARMP